ncbi:hypothetical protein BJN34_33070 [Cupriavidus necator]|uniref:Transposase n=1 Tax=Cupriavidus necator TaxID=106590 RepID=A0A1U9V1A2_CUPNE|nr:hypothetical protein BJN34_33070 [Cupriavidus necator]
MGQSGQIARFYGPQGLENANSSHVHSKMPVDRPVKRQFRGLFSVALSGISKRGDPYLRTLLIHGARVVLSHLCRKNQPGWSLMLAQRRPKNVAAVALANKTVRTIWALLAHDRAYDRDYVSVRPA